MTARLMGLLEQCFLTTQMHAGLHVRGLPFQVDLSLFKGEANLLCCHAGRQLKVNQYEEEEKKKKSWPLCKDYRPCLFPHDWWRIMCGAPAAQRDSSHQTSLSPTHHASLGHRPSPR